ncbi:MAG: serine/threonine-protein kinase [Gemmatimonadaceae bacterium]
MSEDGADHLRQLRALFDAVMDRPEGERREFLDQATGWDATLRREVDALISASEHTDVSLEMFDFGSTVAPEAGQRLGAYEVVRLVGTGGMGAVYEATRADDQYRKRVAIKIVQGGLDSELTLGRFRRERQIHAGLEHPNIATLLDGGMTPAGQPFLVMEFVEGLPITTWCNRHELGVRERVALFRQVCGAVQHAHKNLVVHRDLKPGNILVTEDGTVKLLDFGIAKLLGDDASDDAMPLTRGGVRPFTPEYASPEQVHGDTLSTSSDVYSLGVVLFELLAGRRPHLFPSRSLSDIEHALTTEPVPRPSAVATESAARESGERSENRLRRRLRGDLDQIVLMALRQEPARRYASVDALDADLRRYLTGLPIAAQRDWLGYRFRKFVRRNVAAVAASALVLLALVGGVIATSSQAKRARAEQVKAERVSDFLRGLLSSVRPAMGGRDVPVSELLDAAARRTQTELAGQPDERAELETVIGESYQSLGRYDEAAPHLATALALREQMGGAASEAAIVGLSNVAGLALARDELDRADSLFTRALALQRSRTSKPDSLVAVLLDNLGSVAHKRGQDSTGERLHREALTIRRQIVPPTDDMIGYSLNNVAVSLGDQGRMAEAEPLHREAVAIFRRNHPGPDPTVADALNSLATALDLEGKNAAAESTYIETIAMRRQLVGPEHPDYAWTVFNYAMFEFDQHRYKEAMQLSREVLALRGKTIAENNPSIAASLQTVGRCLDQLGDTVGAERSLVESLNMRKKYLPASSWLIASSESVLGEHYTIAGELRKSEPLLLHAQRVMEQTFGIASPRTQGNVRRLVSLYEKSGQPAKAATYRAMLARKTG